MPRKSEAGAEFGSDSFLDVVANLVGILIILVVVAGLRIQHMPATTSDDSEAIDLAQPRTTLASLQRDLSSLSQEQEAAKRRAAAQHAHRQRLQLAIEAQQRELASRRQSLDAQAQREVEAQRDLLSAQSLVEQLQRDLEQAASTKKSVTIESYPTPLARTVNGPEQHFQLRHGRIAYIPMDDLLEKLKADAPSQFWKLKDLPEATATVGPLRGFRLRYTFQRVEVPLEDQMAGRRLVGSFAQLSQWTLIPSDDYLGETIDQALQPNSEFFAVLARQDPRDCTVTLWTYPDSFAEFRRLKKELYTMGFAIAGRPLPSDAPIGGSPRGSKSVAQ